MASHAKNMQDAKDKIQMAQDKITCRKIEIAELRAQIRDEEKKLKRATAQRIEELRAQADALALLA